MSKLEDLQNPEFLESAAEELRAEAERVQAAAQRLRAGESLNVGERTEQGLFSGFSFEACSNICGQCCFCSPC
ncbi:MAG TPA: hypothetical protein V6D11_10435 [Waterburya sp.]|jgi:hypothetical protein